MKNFRFLSPDESLDSISSTEPMPNTQIFYAQKKPKHIKDMEDLIINSTDALNGTQEENRQIENYIDENMPDLWRSRDQVSPYKK